MAIKDVDVGPQPPIAGTWHGYIGQVTPKRICHSLVPPVRRVLPANETRGAPAKGSPRMADLPQIGPDRGLEWGLYSESMGREQLAFKAAGRPARDRANAHSHGAGMPC